MKKIIKRVFLGLLVLIILVMALNYKTIGWVWDNLTAPMYDFDETKPDTWEAGTIYDKVQYSDVSDTDYVNIYIPDDLENPPLFVMVHGGGFVTNDNMSRQARLAVNYFRDHGYAVASVNYRLAQEATYPAAIQDVKACVRYLRAHASEYGYDSNQIFIGGESAGGYLATMAAVTNDEEYNDLDFIDQDTLGNVSARVSGLVDIYGVVDMAVVEDQWDIIGLPDIVYTIANSWAMSYKNETGASSIEEAWIGKEFSEMTAEELYEICPMYYFEKNIDLNKELSIWITHGSSDITVPILQSEGFYELAKELGVENLHYEVIAHGKHADDRCYSDEQLEMIASFLGE